MTPDRLTIQWHLTDLCNYRCKHCYQESYADNGLDYQILLEYLRKFEEFVVPFKQSNKEFRAHINFTGGEPFLKPELLDLLELVNKNGFFSFGILSNGFLLSESQLIRLKKLKPRFVQLSLEGNEKTNDAIRGKGSFKEIIHAIKTYKKLGIPVLISFTANSKNFKTFPDVVRIARKFKVYKVWSDRYLPNNKTDELLMSTTQVQEFFQIINHEQKRKLSNFFSKTIISSGRALQFLTNGGLPYSCSAGMTLLAILPNGDILPCRRLPIKIGNMDRDNLTDIFQNNTVLKDLRLENHPDNECSNCYYNKSCNGGLKCLSHIQYGDFNRKDPNCWI